MSVCVYFNVCQTQRIYLSLVFFYYICEDMLLGKVEVESKWSKTLVKVTD